MADDNSAVVLFDDILSLAPQLYEFSGAEDISEFMDRVMEFYEYPVFLNSVHQSDIQFLTGDDLLLIDGSTPSITHFFESDTKAKIYSGSHDLILNDSSVEISQVEGQISIFLDSFQNNEIALDVLNGEVCIYNSDNNFDIDQLYFREGVIYDSLGSTGIVVNNYQENLGNIRIVSLNDQRELDLSSFDEFSVIEKNLSQNQAGDYPSKISHENSDDSHLSSQTFDNYENADNLEELSNFETIFQAEDIDLSESLDFLESSSSLGVTDSLIADTILTDDIDILLDTVAEEIDTSLDQIKTAELKIDKSINFDVVEFVQFDGYTDLNIENAIEYVEDL